MTNIAESNRVIKRDRYLNKIISYMWDGQIKVITGIYSDSTFSTKALTLPTFFRLHSISQKTSNTATLLNLPRACATP